MLAAPARMMPALRLQIRHPATARQAQQGQRQAARQALRSSCACVWQAAQALQVYCLLLLAF
jgi:hypothetical protein